MNRANFVLIVLAITCSYLVVSLFTGSRSVFRMSELDRAIALVEEDLSEQRSTNAELVRRIESLEPETIDYDLLEEEIKRHFGVGMPGEWIVPASELERATLDEPRG